MFLQSAWHMCYSVHATWNTPGVAPSQNKVSMKEFDWALKWSVAPRKTPRTFPVILPPYFGASILWPPQYPTMFASHSDKARNLPMRFSRVGSCVRKKWLQFHRSLHKRAISWGFKMRDIPCPIWLDDRGARQWKWLEEVPRCTLLSPIAFPCFVLCLIGVEAEGLLDYQGGRGSFP